MQSEINRCFGVLKDGPAPNQVITDSAVFKARHKLSPTAFFRLNDRVCEFFYQHGQPRLWHGFRLLAIDGSTLRLPNTADIVEFFGRQEPIDGSPSVPLAQISELFDPLNGITVAATIAPYEEGERALLVREGLWIKVGTLLLADQGYPAFWLWHWIQRQKAHFCFRLSPDQWKCAGEFVSSGERERIIDLSLPSQESRRQCREHDLPTTPLRVRLIRVDLPNGEVEVLGTSLTDADLYPAGEFQALYHLRWSNEEKFKRNKCRAEMENFSGLSPWTVLQDFYARIFSMNLTVLLAWPIQPEIEQQYAERKYRYQVNWASALIAIKASFAQLFYGSGLAELLERLHQWFIENVSPIRPNRCYPRNHKHHKRVFYINYKPCL